MTAFTLLTLNIHKGFSAFNRRPILDELRLAIGEVSAGVVCLQEVGGHDPQSRRHADWPDAPHYEFLADTLWPQHAYGRNAVFPGGHLGNAVLSKFPIASFRNHDVSLAGAEPRSGLWCVLDVPGHHQRIHVVSVHLGLLERHRRHQLDALCQLVDREIPPGAPLIVAGDFNDWRQRADRVLARSGLQEAFVAATGRPARTFPARWPLLPMDRIYVRNAAIERAQVLSGRPWSHLSDHTPLLVDIST